MVTVTLPAWSPLTDAALRSGADAASPVGSVTDWSASAPGTTKSAAATSRESRPRVDLAVHRFLMALLSAAIVGRGPQGTLKRRATQPYVSFDELDPAAAREDEAAALVPA